MGVIINLHPKHKNTDEWLCMSNIRMDIFLSVIVLSGSRLAVKKREKELIQWFCERDDTIRGRGCNGFSICDIPWKEEDFEYERKFLLKVVDGAKEKLGWDVLDYEVNESNEDVIFQILEKFKILLINFSKEFIIKDGYSEWLKDNNILEFRVP
ncbi:MAG: hypothetical protein Q8900_08590 [Bacillota bacterium]|nr:hypothetical protein [Bacillota bacterium]